MFDVQKEFTGRVVIEMVNRDKRHLDVDRCIVDSNGNVLFLVTVDRDYYNFNNVIRIHKETRVF